MTFVLLCIFLYRRWVIGGFICQLLKKTMYPVLFTPGGQEASCEKLKYVFMFIFPDVKKKKNVPRIGSWPDVLKHPWPLVVACTLGVALGFKF